MSFILAIININFEKINVFFKSVRAPKMGNNIFKNIIHKACVICNEFTLKYNSNSNIPSITLFKI